jgi:excisionase family DNA binding protein
VAKALQVSRQSVTRRCQSGVIKGIKIGDLWRIPHAEVERLLGQEIAAE